MKLTPTKYSYTDFIEISIYSDLKVTLKADDRIVLQSNNEYSDVIEQLNEINIPHVVKSKREICITASDSPT